MGIKANGEIEYISVERIDRDECTQSRVEIDRERVTQYAKLMRDNVDYKFPPIDLFWDQKTGICYIGDGWHRFLACLQSHTPNVRSVVQKGTQRDAIKWAVKANDNHGENRNDEDKRKAVKMLLDDPEWNQLSNKKLADMANVSDTFVATCKRELKIPAGPTIGKDGKTRRPPKKSTAVEPQLSESTASPEPDDFEFDDQEAGPEVAPAPPTAERDQRIQRMNARTRQTDRLSELVRLIRQVKREYKAEAEREPDGHHLKASGAWTRMEQLLSSTANKLEAAKPSDTCADCEGIGCSECKMTGWVVCTKSSARVNQQR